MKLLRLNLPRLKVSGRTALALAAAAAAVWTLPPGVAHADDAGRQTASPQSAAKSPIVVEMFLSQSCNSCTAAAALMPALAARSDVVALSWHVDYWNMLNTKQGRWVDPYSEAAFTTRQKAYNMRLRKRSSVYTPQAIVNGEMEAVGSSGDKINDMLAQAASREDRTGIEATAEDGAISFRVGESDAGGNAFLVTFKREVTTQIPRGENAGHTFDEVNVVTGVKPLGVVLRRGKELTAEGSLAADEGCALIVQEPKQARIIAAAYCPS